MGEVVAFIRRPTPRGQPGKPLACAGRILLFTGAWRERYDDAAGPHARPSRKGAARAAQKRRKKA